MKLTPIKVRGKRKQSKKVAMASRTRSESPDVLEQPAPKRSKKQHAKDTPRLLQLPQEMLERIFIGSKNLALPLVNHELHRRLSTDSVKYQLVGVAFGPTWDAWHGKDCYELHSYAGWAVDKARIEGDAAFQVSSTSFVYQCIAATGLTRVPVCHPRLLLGEIRPVG